MSKNNFLSGIYPISPIKYDSDYTYLDLVEKALKTNIKIFQFRGKHLSLRRKRSLVPKINERCIKYGIKLIFWGANPALTANDSKTQIILQSY